MFPILDEINAQLKQTYDDAVAKNHTTRAGVFLTALEIFNKNRPDIEHAQLDLIENIEKCKKSSDMERAALFLEAIEIIGEGKGSIEYRAAAQLLA